MMEGFQLHWQLYTGGSEDRRIGGLADRTMVRWEDWQIGGCDDRKMMKCGRTDQQSVNAMCKRKRNVGQWSTWIRKLYKYGLVVIVKMEHVAQMQKGFKEDVCPPGWAANGPLAHNNKSVM